jgi:diguanylate cyclase (GGDEF)-like protein
MRISTITNWAYGVTVALTVVSGGAFLLSAHSAAVEQMATEAAWNMDQSVDQLASTAEQTSEDARLYVMKGEDRYLAAFRDDESKELAREQAVKNLIRSGLSSEERTALSEVEADAEALDAIEQQAVADFKRGDQSARQVLFGSEHERLQRDLLSSVAHFTALVATRAAEELSQAKRQNIFWGSVAKTMLGFTAVVFLSVLYFVLKRRVAMPLLQMTGVVRRLAKQDYDVEVAPDNRRDEIGEMNEAIQIFRDNGLERNRLDAERKRDQHIKDLILQMMHRLQACQDERELTSVVSLFAPQIFPDLSGRLYAMNDGRTVLDEGSRWGEPEHSPSQIPALYCWGIRRGRPHISDDIHGDVACEHITGERLGCMCVPLAAHGDTVGMLYFESSRAGEEFAAARVYIELIAENIGLAVANLQLRDRLTNLATRDPLTGLLNRRALDSELNRLRRQHMDMPAALLMIDIDHFKRFNDDFGHDAGDYVMKQVAAIMTEIVADAGSVHRFGGEEFSVILRGVERQPAFARAEAIRRAVETAPINYLGKPLGTVTISIGVASTENGGPATTIMARADAALLRAKRSGRNATLCDWTHDEGSGKLAVV